MLLPFVAPDHRDTSILTDVNPWMVGIAVLAFFMIMLIALLAFGKGREHS